MNNLTAPSVVEDSHGDEDSDYTFEADLTRHKTRRAKFEIELKNHSQAMSARRSKRKHSAPAAAPAPSTAPSNSRRRHDKLPSTSSSSLSSALSPPRSPSDNESDDDILAFLQPKTLPVRRGIQSAAPKLTMADIQARVAKNKARDEEIHRAQKLLDEGEALNQKKQTQPSSSNITAYLKSQEGVPAILNVLNPGDEKSNQLPKWSFFSSATVTGQISPNELCALIRDSSCISAFLGSNRRELDVENIRDLLVSGAMTDCLEGYPTTLELPLRHLLFDAVCLSRDEDISFSCLTLITTLHEQFESILDQKRLHRIFELIGGSRGALNLSMPLKPTCQEEGGGEINERAAAYSPSWWNICLVLEMLSNLVQGATDDVLRLTWGFVVRFSLDEQRMKERRGQPEFLGLMEALLEQLERRSNSLVKAILLETRTHITDRTFQAQLLGILPTTGGFSHDFRKRLARLFLSGNPVYTGPEPSPGVLMGSILTALKSKEVRMSKSESHSQLQNVVDIIDIAVDDARWCANVVEKDEKGHSENLLEKLILHLKHSKEFIQDAGLQLNIDKSNAKDSFAKLVIRLEGIRQKKRGTQTAMEKYFRPNLG
ncbi:hypothetical protein TWF718_004825 [Orbilia javanica]|uniref:Uncharacterized protein n=1 Tax=Orbilia javanica TaxID=47235 RepID=A0AAN8N6K7_9PEZI